MSIFSKLSRRRFLSIASASTGTALLHGCLENPPEVTGAGQNAIAF